MYRFAYLTGEVMLAIVWLLFFFLRKDLRKQQLFVSLLTALFTPLADVFWFYQDYWRPEYSLSFRVGPGVLGIESPLCGFLIGGIAAILYEVIFKKRHSFGRPRHIAAIAMIFFVLLTTTLLIKIGGLNSIWASSFTLLLGSIIMLMIDKDLIKDAVMSGVLMTIIILVLYSVWFAIYPNGVQKLWVTQMLSGVKIGRIPIEEIVWFGSAGMGLGILYEFWLNVEKYPKKLKT